MKIIITEGQLRKLYLEDDFGGRKSFCKDYKCEEIVDDLSKVDFYYEYRRLNSLLFDNKLPKNIPIEIANFRSHGIFRYKGSYGSFLARGKIFISKRYINNFGVFLGTLAHEMIHVYQWINNIQESNGGHGPVFFREADRINAIAKSQNLGFKIAQYGTEEESSKLISENIKPRVVLYEKKIKFDKNNQIISEDEPHIKIFHVGAFSKTILKYLDWVKFKTNNNPDSKYIIKAWVIKHNDVAKLKVMQNCLSNYYYPYNNFVKNKPGFFDLIKNEGKLTLDVEIDALTNLYEMHRQAVESLVRAGVR